jgi:hypothetical protein
VTNEWPRDLIGGNIHVGELLDALEYAMQEIQITNFSMEVKRTYFHQDKEAHE